MQKTTNYDLNKIEKTDKIVDSIEALGRNVEILDEELMQTLNNAKRYVDEEIAKFDFIKIVDTLPEIGLPNRIYFVPKTDSQTQDLFDEYAWINEKWEWITTKQIEVDLSLYALKEEIPTKTSQLENNSNYIASTTIKSVEFVSTYPSTEQTGVLYIKPK